MEFSFLIEKGKTKSILNLKFCFDCPLFISLCLSTLCFNPLSSSKYWFSLLVIICINLSVSDDEFLYSQHPSAWEFSKTKQSHNNSKWENTLGHLIPLYFGEYKIYWGKNYCIFPNNKGITDIDRTRWWGGKEI